MSFEGNLALNSRGLKTSPFLDKDLIQKYTNIIVVDAPDGMPATPPVEGIYWYIKDPDVYRRVLVQGDLGLGESYLVQGANVG